MSRCHSRRTNWCAAGLGAVVLFAASPAHAQPFLSFDFDDGDLSSFARITAVDLCGTALPSGTGTADDSEVLLMNDDGFGISIFGILPSVVADNFPASRNYRLRVRVNLESINELLVYVRARGGLSAGNTQLNSALERGYAFAVFPQLVDPEFPDGVVGLAEFEGCHELVDHVEWPGGVGTGFARIGSPVPIFPGDWYFLEVTSQGNDNGGPIRLTAKFWLDGDDEPEAPILDVVDLNGLPHTAMTLSPAADMQVFFGTSFDVGQQPGATARIDDLTLTELRGCADTPAIVTRTLWQERTVAEGALTAVLDEGSQYDVNLAISSVRAAGVCTAPSLVSVVETIPAGLVASDPSDGGRVEGGAVVWDLNLAGGGGAGAAALSYKVAIAPAATFGGPILFQGSIAEPNSEFSFATRGESLAAARVTLSPISDFGSIQQWLILGPFIPQVVGANPGAIEIARDYLTDGDTAETEIMPSAGETITPDYNGAAASTGLQADSFGRNPNGTPTWVEWRDFDDADDRIDFETVYGDVNEVMCYALTYLNVLEDTMVNFGISSDDAVQVLIDGVSLHLNPVARGALGRNYQDSCISFMNLCEVELAAGIHTVVVKVFEGGGEHNFRIGFVDSIGVEIPGGPPEIEVCLEPDCGGPPPELFRRGDIDVNAAIEITDAIKLLNFLFLGLGGPPLCPDSADSDDNGQLELTDAIRVLGFLFLGGIAPPAPGPMDCGLDPMPDPLGPCEYAPAAGC